jgi:hypothetical protein
MSDQQRQLRDEVRQLLVHADAADAADDAAYGADQQGDELPAELQRRESRVGRIREAKQALEAPAKAEAAAAGESPDTAKPKSISQYNFTDPESRIMKRALTDWSRASGSGNRGRLSFTQADEARSGMPVTVAAANCCNRRDFGNASQVGVRLRQLWPSAREFLTPRFVHLLTSGPPYRPITGR